MSCTTENRNVPRQVKVYRCDRCRAEATEDAVSGWGILITIELQPQSDMFGQVRTVSTAKPGGDRHVCPACLPLAHALLTEQPAPTMVGNDIANIPIRTNDGTTVMLTRFEYDRWAAQGKPPVLSAADVKVKS